MTADTETPDLFPPAESGEQAIEFLRTLGFKPEWRTYGMAHSVCLEEIASIGNWLKRVSARDR